MSAPDLPPREVSLALSNALGPMRARLLRRIGVAHRGPVLDLGAGWGFVTEELVRRARGPVVAVDRNPEAVAALGARGLHADATSLPFPPRHFELVFCQHVLMWQRELAPVLAEIRRVLAPGGVLVALEPDWGGAMEDPEEVAVADIARAALSRAGANPLCGRALPAALAQAGFTDTRVDLIPSPAPADDTRFALLADLDLTSEERARLTAAQHAQSNLPTFVHIPVLCATTHVVA